MRSASLLPALHILTGDPSLFSPVRLPAAALVQSVSPSLQNVPANWLARGQADHGHDFLLDRTKDRRIAMMARTLAIDFSDQAEPCLVLPSLMDEHQRGAALAMLIELARALAQMGQARYLALRAMSLPDQPDPMPSLEAVTAELCGHGVHTKLANNPAIYPESGRALESRMRRNLLVLAVAQEVTLAAAELGLRAPEPSRMLRLCESWLSIWHSRGLVPDSPMDPDHLRRLAETVLRSILMAAPEPPSPQRNR